MDRFHQRCIAEVPAIATAIYGLLSADENWILYSGVHRYKGLPIGLQVSPIIPKINKTSITKLCPRRVFTMKRKKRQRLCDVHLGLWLVKEFQQKQWQCYLQWHQTREKWQVTKTCCCSRVPDKISLHWQGAISGLNIQMKPAVLGFEYSAQHKPTNWHPCRRACLHFSSLCCIQTSEQVTMFDTVNHLNTSYVIASDFTWEKMDNIEKGIRDIWIMLY